MAAFLGHIAHESGSLHNLEENLNYKDPQRLNKIFGAIKTDKEAEAYVNSPEALANKVYANRNGNGDTASGDGWRYRGRGLIQLTGKANYAAFAKDLNVDVVKDPDLGIRCMDPVWNMSFEFGNLIAWNEIPNQRAGICFSGGSAGGMVKGPTSLANSTGSRRARVAAQYLGASSR